MMVQMTTARESVQERPRVAEAPEVMSATEQFLEAARARGLEPLPLRVRPLEAPLFGLSERRRRVVEVGWRQRYTLRLGKREVSWTLPRGGTFYQMRPEEMVLPERPKARYHDSLTLPGVEERSVFVERVDPILAVRVEGQWYELDRWMRPVQFTPGVMLEWM